MTPTPTDIGMAPEPSMEYVAFHLLVTGVGGLVVLWLAFHSIDD